VRFEDTLDAVADGLARRGVAVDDALTTYGATCGAEYRPPVDGAGTTVRDLAYRLRLWGNWVGDVGRAFIAAAAAAEYTDPGTTNLDFERVYGQPDKALVEHLSDHLGEDDDPYRGIQPGAAQGLAEGLGVTYDQDDPPAWVSFLDRGGNTTEILGELLTGAGELVTTSAEWATISVRMEGRVVAMSGDDILAAAFAADLHARIRLPGAGGPRLRRAGRWIGRAGTAIGHGSNFLSAAGGSAGQWHDDAGRSTGPRVGRAFTRGFGPTMTGALTGAAAGSACGPGAPVCSTALGIAGGILGATAGDRVVDQLPWMQPFLPAEHDPDYIRGRMAALDAPVTPELAATVDLAASDLARQEIASEAPEFRARVDALLPDADLLRQVIETGSAPQVPMGVTGPITVPKHAPIPADQWKVPDPWVEPRPWE
jgi:hypothetical protein